VAEASAEVLTRVEGTTGLIVLNRPSAINSLSHSMVMTIESAISDWEYDDDVRTVVLSGAGERGLCAGGDVVTIYHSARADGAQARRFWYDEYRLNAHIGRYAKPLVTLMDGIVMGGGVGLGAHAGIRVVTDTSKVAMPEVGIGFVPDVGGTYLLSRAPGLLGLHAALTGAPLSGADAIAMGLADHYVPHSKLADFEHAIIQHGIDAALTVHAIAPPGSGLVVQRDWVDECYAGESVADIVDRLRGHDAAAAHDAAAMIATRSPTALAVTLQAVRRAACLGTLEEVLEQEYRVSCATLRSHDLVEGIRAQLIDKDRDPKWSPASLAEIADADVETFFATTGQDLSFGKTEIRQ
jgi:enoyl-CoA hydratase